MINRRVDEEVGIIYVTGEGYWSREEVDQHQELLQAIVTQFRESGRRVRILSDVTAAPRQTPEIEAYIMAAMERTYHSNDRIAILTRNEDDRGHVRSLLNGVEVALFTSRLAAEMWLLHDRLDVPAGNGTRRA